MELFLLQSVKALRSRQLEPSTQLFLVLFHKPLLILVAMFFPKLLIQIHEFLFAKLPQPDPLHPYLVFHIRWPRQFIQSVDFSVGCIRLKFRHALDQAPGAGRKEIKGTACTRSPLDVIEKGAVNQPLIREAGHGGGGGGEWWRRMRFVDCSRSAAVWTPRVVKQVNEKSKRSANAAAKV